MELNDQLVTEIEIFEDTSFKELEYIRTHDWTVVQDRADRLKEYRFQMELMKNNLNLASRFYTIAKDDLVHPTVKSAMDKFNEFLLIALKRFEDYKKDNDWTTYSESGPVGKRNTDIRAEIQFQTTMVQEIQTLKSLWKRIDSGGQIGSLSIGVHRDEPLPIMFEKMATSRHPEINEFIEKRRIAKKK